MDEIENRIRGAHSVLLERRQQHVATISSLRQLIADIDQQIADAAGAARLFNIELPPSPQPIPLRDSTLKEIVWSKLQACPNGFRVSAHRSEIEHEFGRPAHAKSIGVALYRLKSDGKARREKHVWFALNADAA